GLELDIPGLDPLKVGVYDTAAEMAASLIFDTLTTLDDNGKAAPKLALSWTHSEDFKTRTFKLRSGAQFHARTPLHPPALPRHRAFRAQVMDRRRPVGARAQSRLLEPRPAVSRPRRHASASRCTGAVRQPARR